MSLDDIKTTYMGQGKGGPELRGTTVLNAATKCVLIKSFSIIRRSSPETLVHILSEPCRPFYRFQYHSNQSQFPSRFPYSFKMAKTKDSRAERHQVILAELLKEEANKYCADCGVKGDYLLIVYDTHACLRASLFQPSSPLGLWKR